MSAAQLARVRAPRLASLQVELHDAVRSGAVRRTAELLHARADPDAIDIRGMAAVHVACQAERVASIPTILSELDRTPSYLPDLFDI